MSISHHIPDEMLLAYASGSAPEAWSLIVASHLSLCPDCQELVSKAEQVGGELLNAQNPEQLNDDAFEVLMRTIDATAGTEEILTKPARDVPSVLPEPLRSYVGGDLHALKWRRLGKGVFHIPIATADGKAQAR